jgi:spore germination protein GerM
MKGLKIIAMLMAALLIAALSGCQSGIRQSPEPTANASSDTSSLESQSPSQSPESSQEPSEPPSEEPSVELSPTPGSSESPAALTMDVVVYYLKSGTQDIYLVREVHALPKSDGIARAALNELISGTPTTEDAYRVLPSGTKILGIKIENGLATVEFSKEVLSANVGAEGEGLGIDSIVNTLTEFPTIQQVAFTVEGSAENGMEWWGHVGLYEQPFSRNLGMVWEPAIWVTSPVNGDKVTSPIKLHGSASVFEGTVNYRLKDEDGNILAESFTTALMDEFYRGDFDASIPFTPTAAGQGQLEVFTQSAMDGSEIDKVIIPVTW